MKGMFFSFALILSVGIGSSANAASWSCSVECSLSVNKIVGSKWMSGWDPREVSDFKAYCDDLGGSLYLGPGTCAGVNDDNFQCVQNIALKASGSAYRTDLFEARQAARKNCEERLIQSRGNNCSPNIASTSSNIFQGEPECH